MSTSYLDIGGSNYTISVTSWSETDEELIDNKTLIPSNINYGDNSVLSASGNNRKTISISGYATLSVRGTIQTAKKANSIIKPYIYPFDSSTNITSGEYYYIKSIAGSYANGDSKWTFTLELIYGGTY